MLLLSRSSAPVLLLLCTSAPQGDFLAEWKSAFPAGYKLRNCAISVIDITEGGSYTFRCANSVAHLPAPQLPLRPRVASSTTRTVPPVMQLPGATYEAELERWLERTYDAIDYEQVLFGEGSEFPPDDEVAEDSEVDGASDEFIYVCCGE